MTMHRTLARAALLLCLALTVALDTYDQAFFPTRGFKLDVTHFDAQHVWANDPGLGPYSRSEARFGAAWSHNRFTYLAGLEGGTALKGTLPLADAFTLGGPRRMSGFAVDQMLGGDYTFGRLEGQYRLNWASPLWGLTLIAGLSAEAGRMNKLLTDKSLAGWQHSYGAYLAANTFLGPVYFGVADAKNGKGRFYLFIGSPPRFLLLQLRAAGPAEIEGGRILLAALRAGDRGARGVGAQELVDHQARARGVVGILDPELREREVDRNLARQARGVRVEDPGANAPGVEEICEEVGLRQVGCGVDALQNR